MLKLIALIIFLSSCSLISAEMVLDFARFSGSASLSGFSSTVTGLGNPSDWKIIQDEIPATMTPLSPKAPGIGKRPVLAQFSRDKQDEHFPLLIFNEETFGDFTLTTKFKCVGGSVERMAGIAFRIQDEKNYYVVRASALGNSFRFYKFVHGERSAPIGPQIEIPSGVWQEMSVICKGNQIRCLLNGKEVIPALTDNSFSSGRIGFWTKSDSVSYFADTKIDYTPRVRFAQRVIDATMGQFPRLIGLKIVARNHSGAFVTIASSDSAEVNDPGKTVEGEVISTGTPYYAKSKEAVAVIMPLRDRNGEITAALRVTLKPFPGQTEKNALGRALPIVKEIESQIVSAKDLTQ